MKQSYKRFRAGVLSADHRGKFGGKALVSRGALIFGLVFSPIFSFAVHAQSAVTEQEAQAIARDAYIYFYPLLTMDVTGKQLTNVEPGKGIGAPMNNLFSVPTFPTADMKQVVRPNFDTLYSFGYLDLTKEPIVSVPDTGGRYYLLPMLDMWTDVFASPGWRTTGTQAGNFLVTPLGWSGTVPAGFTLIEAPTPLVWIIGRTKTDGPADYEAVHKIQAGYKITPLSDWGKSRRIEVQHPLSDRENVATEGGVFLLVPSEI